MRRVHIAGIADQALASASNVAITVVAARALDRAAFGGFALVFAAYVFAAGATRALVTEPLLLRAGGPTAGREAVAGATGAAVVFGIIAGSICAMAGLLVGGAGGNGLLALGAFLPFLMLQDSWRYRAFAIERPAGALLVDGVWVAAEAVGVTLALVMGRHDATSYVVAWAAGGTVAALVGCVHARIVPRVQSSVAWVRANADLGGPFLVEFLAGGGGAYIGVGLLGVVSGLAAVGAVRVVYTVFGPINVLSTGISLTVVPERLFGKFVLLEPRIATTRVG